MLIQEPLYEIDIYVAVEYLVVSFIAGRECSYGAVGRRNERTKSTD